ncbi:hypothetical protein CYLTODRAFT_460469 [Cylindrobasidium torrendii FP15055 ss-10]|uniref:Protein kinase domain-containing protein n=1 Tax=Cylindrobasidium torrendii FP15055 ss-10 TaxID=1314674 RepID=A0A0D7ARW7_9AGAR|nr:hypothetical protein CYLTODRAFT_460469 [Cylindrobasidium torrendii FP15055 ss-10]
MAKQGFAPELRYYGLLGDGYGNLGMVVMAWVEGKTLYEVYGAGTLPEDVRTNVREALDILNQNGFVFGDLRRPNITVGDSDQSIKFIDFDWAGKSEEVRYPFHLSSFIRDAAGAKEYDYITVAHQDAMFERL